MSPDWGKDEQRRVVWSRLQEHYKLASCKPSKQTEQYHTLHQGYQQKVQVKPSHEPLFHDTYSIHMYNFAGPGPHETVVLPETNPAPFSTILLAQDHIQLSYCLRQSCSLHPPPSPCPGPVGASQRNADHLRIVWLNVTINGQWNTCYNYYIPATTVQYHSSACSDTTLRRVSGRILYFTCHRH